MQTANTPAPLPTQAVVIATPTPTATTTPTIPPSPSPLQSSEIFTVVEKNPIPPSAITWNTTPKERPDIGGIAPKEDTQEGSCWKKDKNDIPLQYIEFGVFTAGKYKDYKIIKASNISSNDIMCPSEFLALENNKKITILTKGTDSNLQNEKLENGKSVFAAFLFDNQLVIPELSPPETITLQSTSGLKISIKKTFANVLKENAVLGEKIASFEPYGDLSFEGKIEANSEKKPTSGIYLSLKDGTFQIYELVPSILRDQIPSLTWTGGVKNKNEYSYTDIGGCGSKNLASVITDSFTAGDKKIPFAGEKDLAQTGTAPNGDVIFELKDPNHPFLKFIYTDQYSVYEGKKISYSDFTATHPVFFWRDPFGRLIKFENSKFIPQAECGKPVIYLYPQQEEKVSVQVEPQGGMSVSIPEYGNGWTVNAKPNGELTEISSGKKYQYLFWEGRGGLYQTPTKGWSIPQSEVHSFLVEKLALLGLNEKETADFLEFWEPRMQDSPYYFVTFLGTQGMNQLAPLTITPKPNTVVRILMDFQPLSAPISVEPFKIVTPKREGFTVIEWGGVLRK